MTDRTHFQHPFTCWKPSNDSAVETNDMTRATFTSYRPGLSARFTTPDVLLALFLLVKRAEK
ncbi:MAG: hypothetical protein MOP51_1680 [Citricoccus sp.]|nr:hypothetical protein [Citricoccus sp. WCRC_4]